MYTTELKRVRKEWGAIKLQRLVVSGLRKGRKTCKWRKEKEWARGGETSRRSPDYDSGFVFRRLSFRLSPLHPLDSALRSRFHLLVSVLVSPNPHTMQHRRVTLSPFNWFLKTPEAGSWDSTLWVDASPQHHRQDAVSSCASPAFQPVDNSQGSSLQIYPFPIFFFSLLPDTSLASRASNLSSRPNTTLPLFLNLSLSFSTHSHRSYTPRLLCPVTPLILLRATGVPRARRW